MEREYIDSVNHFFVSFVAPSSPAGMNTFKTYADRAARHPNACAKALFDLMERKQTNLSIAADVTTKKELLHIADACGPYICILKVRSRFAIGRERKWVQLG